MSWASCLCVNGCDKVWRSISVTRNDQLKCETKVDSIVHAYQVGFKTNFIKQKYYRTCVWYLNKVWSINFVDDNEMPMVEKMILLAKIFNSLEIANGNQIQLKNLEIFKFANS